MTRPLALVTGASSGIGLTFARRLAAHGYDLVVVARRGGRLEELAAELEGTHGAVVEVLAADLTDNAGLTAIEERLRAAPPVDLLVNNAGFATFGRFADLPIDKEIEEINLNVVALVRLTHAALPGLLERRTGGVINVASIAAYQPGPFEATYCATKAFVNSFSQGVHEEVKGAGLTVLSLCPGLTRTEFQEKGGGSAESMPKLLSQSAEQVVDSALRAFKSGRAVRIPGVPNKVGAGLARLSPQIIGRKLASSIGQRLAQV